MTLRHVMFGRSGLRVSELCLGAMLFGDARQFGASPEESRSIFDAFASAGGTFIDTADHYADGESERLLGRFLAADRDHFVVSTKWSVSRSGGLQKSGNSRRNMMRAVEGSLRRLATDHIDIYSLHVWDFATPCEEIMRGLDDLVRSGKVHYVAVSDTPAWEISRANMLADLRGWSAFAGIQIEYNLTARTPERDLIPMAIELGLAITAWSPLAGGVLSGKYGSAQGRSEAGRWSGADVPQRTLDIAQEVSRVAERLGVTASQVALSWLRRQTVAVPIIPIIGARTRAQLEGNLQSAAVHLDDQALRQLDQVSQIELGFPHDFLRTDYVRAILHGGEPDHLVLRRPIPHPTAALALSSGVTKR
jgi:aryl-alcohol dehydrogenase-like predicted oxidoreductase